MSERTEIPQNMKKRLEEFVNLTEIELNNLKKEFKDEEKAYFLAYRPFLAEALKNQIEIYKSVLDKFYKIFPELDKEKEKE